MPENDPVVINPAVFSDDPDRSASASRACWWVFAVVIAADLLDMIDSTITTIASPAIVRDLGGSDALIPWLGLSYALALGSLLVVGGRLGDRYGQRRTFLFGLVGFTAASVVCGLAPSPSALVAFRIVQGAFGALLIPQGFSLLLAAFPRERLGKVFGLFGPLLATGAIGGPVLAGLLIQANIAGAGWRSIFLINGVIGTGLLVVAPRVLPRSPSNRTVHINPTSSLLSMLGLLGLMGGLISGGDSGWGPRPIAAVSIGVVLLMAFVVAERRTSTPLLAASLFKVPSFVAGLAVGSVYFAAVTGLMYVVSLHLQRGAALSTLQTAAIMAPLSMGIIATSFTLRDHVQRLGRRLVLFGSLLTLTGVVGLMGMLWLVPDRPVVLAAPLFVTGLGMGSCFGSLFATALGDIAEGEAGSASGTLNALQQVANAAGAALVSSVFVALLASHTDRGATSACLVAVAAVLVLTAALTPLLPRHAAADHH